MPDKARDLSRQQDERADLEEQLANARQELAKALKTARSLARNCARAEQKMRGFEENFALITHYGSDLLFRLDRDGKLLEVSPAAQALLGFAPETLQGGKLQDLVAREDAEPVRRYFQQVLRGPVSEGILVHILHRDRAPRTLTMHCRTVPHPQTQALQILGIACLIRPLQAGTSLHDILAHELNQPLTSLAIAVRACSKLAHVKEIDQEELIQAIDQLAEQAERAGELVRRMRQLAVRGTPRWSMVTVQDLIQGALRLLEVDLHNEQVCIELHLSQPIPIIQIDRVQVEQVLVNLIRNAMDAMGDMPRGQRVLTIAAACKDSEVVLVFADTGRGLSPAIAERLFEPYQTTKPQGMGLGLAVSRAILQAHAGRLWVEPAQGRGTTFCLALPLASRES